MRQANILLLTGTLLILSVATAEAQNVDTIDTIVQSFRTASSGWEAALQRFAQSTFGILATIQLCWAVAGLVFRRGDFSEWCATLVNQIMFIGLFYWLLTTTTTWGPAVIDSFRQAGGAAGGTTILTPGDVFKVGLDIAGQIWDKLTRWDPAASAGLAISALIVLACFAWIVLTMVVALVESYFVIAGGVLLMAFGASQWTKDVAIGVVRNVFGIGAKLFGLQLVVAVGAGLIQSWNAQFGTVNAQGVFIEICQALVLAGITKTIPDLFQRMVGGIGTANAGALIGAAASVAAASVAVSTAAARLATGIAGAGATVGAAAQLATTQLAGQGASAPAGVARAVALLDRTAGNVASGIGTDIGRRLSGQGGRFGTSGFRAAADLNERSRLLQEQQAAPVPSSRP